MANNQLYSDGRYIKVPVGAGVESGDPVLVVALTGVAQADRDADGNAVIDRGGSYTLSVHAVNAGGNSAVAVGDMIYHSGTELSKNATGVLFGYALEALGAGLTDEIEVLLK